MSGTLSRRVTALEQHNQAAGADPLYAAFDTDADLDVAQLGPAVVKVYVGCSPDDWPGASREEGDGAKTELA